MSPAAKPCYNLVMQKQTKSGFTLVEISVAIGFLALLFIFGLMQYLTLSAMERDEQRKTAINAMYYSLEEGFYAENGYYPQTISDSVLTTMDPELFTDPNGINLGTEGSSYTYEPADCDDEGHCQQYTLRAQLEHEDDYIRRSRH